MAISVAWGTKTINVPQADLTLVSGSTYELNTETKFRADMNALLAGDEGIVFPDAINHNTQVVLSGITYARIIEIINGYTITFSTEAAPYRVNLIGSNNNIADVTNLSDASIIPSNSAGLITDVSEWTQTEKDLALAGDSTRLISVDGQIGTAQADLDDIQAKQVIMQSSQADIESKIDALKLTKKGFRV